VQTGEDLTVPLASSFAGGIMYDAIVIGARCAGSPTAMLLAQKGHKVLLVDKAAFPSDTISTHIIWPPGTSKLKRWGLLEKVAATGAPLIETLNFDVGPFALSGSLPASDGVSDCYAPRRTVLDKVLLDAAAEAGVEVRESCGVDGLSFDNNGRVTGILCHSQGGKQVTESARIVIGADGRNSIVAREVEAPKYHEAPVYACWYYAYWSGIANGEIEFYARPERAIGFISTNDGLACVAVSSPVREFDRWRSDIGENFTSSLDLTPVLADRLKGGTRETKFFGTADIPNFFRKPYGPGWVLVGDAGYHKDPIGAQGISDAFRDAELAANAVDAGFSGKRPLDEALAEYEQTRNDAVMAMYKFNCELASHEPPSPEMQQLFGALRGNRPDTERFLGTLAGSVPVPEFFAPENTERILAGAVH